MTTVDNDKDHADCEMSSEDRIGDMLWMIMRNWPKLSLKEKDKWIQEAKTILESKENQDDNAFSSNCNEKHLDNISNPSSKILDVNQNTLTGFNAEYGWDYLKNKRDFWKLKYFIWLPTLNNKDKAFIASKIVANNGIIKANLNEVDYVIVSEGVFKGEDKDMAKEQIKLFNYINQRHKDDDEKSISECMNKNIAFIHESTFKSRIAKLVTQAPKKQSELNKEPKLLDPKNMKFSNLFWFLWNSKWKVITLYDLHDVINRQASLNQNVDWFRKRLRNYIIDSCDFKYSSLFWISTFSK